MQLRGRCFFLGKGFSAVAYFVERRRRRAYLRPFLLSASDDMLEALRELSVGGSASVSYGTQRSADVSELQLFVSVGFLVCANPDPICVGRLYTLHLCDNCRDALVDFFVHGANDKNRVKSDDKSAG